MRQLGVLYAQTDDISLCKVGWKYKVDTNMAKYDSYDIFDIYFYNIPDSSIIITSVTSMANLTKSHKNFVV